MPSGVGKKTAERLVVEMKDRLTGWEVAGESSAAASVQGSNQAAEEAESALIALGYKPQEATKMVVRAGKDMGSGATSVALIRAALKNTVS